MAQLVAGGRRLRCERPGCGSIDSSELQLHHVVPQAIKADNTPSNLVILCSDCHALVERFYWFERSRQRPDLCKDIRAIARAFQDRAVVGWRVDEFRRRTTKLWRQLNSEPSMSQPAFWKQTYQAALLWAARQTICRRVNPGNAITEEPWYYDQTSLVA
jgi:hypothetical protein